MKLHDLRPNPGAKKKRKLNTVMRLKFINLTIFKYILEELNG